MIKKKIYKFSENTISLFSIKAIELGLTIWLIPYLILKVGIVNYGLYAYAMALVLIFGNLLNYGFNLVTVRELAKNKKNPSKINELFSEVMSVKLVLFGSLYLCILVLIVLIPEFREHRSLYFYTSLLLVGELFSLRWFFLGMEKMKSKAIINLISTVIYILLVLFFIQGESDYRYIPLYQAIGVVSVAVVSFVWVLKTYHIKLKLISLKEVKSYLIFNFNSFINLVIPSTFGVLSVFLVGVFGLPQHVSFMQIGVKLTSAFSTVNTVLTKVFYPMVNQKESAMKLSRMVLLTIGVVLSLSMFFGSNFLISIWLYKESIGDIGKITTIVKILSPVPFLMAVIATYGVNGLLIFYKDTLYSKITLIAVFTMLLGAVLLIPRYHFYGGAVALLLGRLVHAGLSYFIFKKINLNG